ncbi:epidermal growth factor receptor kinase substrate 8 [Schistosoma bovis]|uniref:Epidermal growth factor receptor kinase substrate 8 n=1 Tax=Schistosoma bovis TaxID=6184 RepID=A0A430QKX9_SCHBO|nr:epidermal growth factor receptor kinase substrate 8 [Schistosoma bovis]
MGSWQVYAREIVEIIHFYGELNETDSVCFIERISLDPSEEKISKYLANNKYQSHHLNDLKILKLNVYDKIIIYECVGLKKEFFEHALKHLEKAEGKLLIIKKLQNWIGKFNDGQCEQSAIEMNSLFRDLLDAGFNIQWDVIDLPIDINYNRWFESVSYCSERLIHNMKASLKYIPLDRENIRMNEQLLIIIASPKLPTDCEFKPIKRSLKSKHKSTNKCSLYQNTPKDKEKVSLIIIGFKNIEIIYKSKLSNIFPEIHNKMNGNRNNSRHVKTYKVQHLRTFEVTPKNVLPNTQTAVELLMQGCYTYVRSFNMSIDDNNDEPYLILSDPRNGDAEVERFRIGRILYPRYRITPPDVCPVNNLLTFTIKAGSMDDGRPRRNEIHLFQVLTCPAQTIVNVLLRAGALDNDSYDQDINDSMLISRAPSEPNLRIPLQTSSSGIQLPPMITKEDSVYSESQLNREWIDLEVALLNHCFDDIESNYKILKSRTTRQFSKSAPSVATSSKSKSRVSSINVNQNSTLVSELDEPVKKCAVDFFEKLKFACILLARLQDYLVDPNSAHLARQLFEFLKYGVDATRNPKTNRSNIAQSTIYPLLPDYVVLFIQSNLTNEYERLWRNLGDAWNVPRYLDFFLLFQTRYMLPPGSNFNVNQSSRTPRDKTKLVQVIESFEASSERELTVENGEWVKILEKNGKWYKVQNKFDEEGYCPGSVLKIPGTM